MLYLNYLTIDDFYKAILGPIRLKAFYEVDEVRLFPKMEDLHEDKWVVGRIGEEYYSLRFSKRAVDHEGVKKMFSIFIKLRDTCKDDITKACVYFLNDTDKRAEDQLPKEVVKAALRSLIYSYGRIRVTSSPPNAKIFVDGQDTFLLTPERFNIGVGRRVIRLEKEKFKPVEFEVEIEEGIDYEVHRVLSFE